MKLRRVSFDEAAQSLIDAAVDPSLWPDTMAKLADYGEAVGAVILPTKGSQEHAPHSPSISEAFDFYIREGWDKRDERFRGLPLLKAKSVFADQDFASEDELKSSEYYRGFLAKHQCNWSAVVGFHDPTHESCLVFERGDRQGYYNEDEQADLARFSQILKDATILARSLDYANAVGVVDAYEYIGCASFLIDEFGRVVRHNQRAEQLIGDGLELFRGYLRSSYQPDNSALRDLIYASLPNAPRTNQLKREVIVYRPTKRPLVIRAIASTGMVKSVFSRASTILLVSDFEQPLAITPRHVLMEAFDLTSSEANLVAKLEQNIALADAAQQLNMALSTAKTHLKRIMAKTETTRQQDLLMLLRRLLPSQL